MSTAPTGDHIEVDALIIDVGRNPGGTRVAVSGEVDIETVGDLRTALAEAIATGDEAIDVDLTGVSFIDSTGLSALMEAKKTAAGRATVSLVAASHPVSRLLEITGLATQLAPSIDAAS